MSIRRRWMAAGVFLCAISPHSFGADSSARKDSKAPVAKSTMPPTHGNLPYGANERQVLDFWRAPSATPTPLLLFIHGGGWIRGDKSLFAESGNLKPYLSKGISVAAINYRFVTDAYAAGVKPPVEWPIHDAARALQFIRSKSAEWNIDKTKIAASGSSAGACSCLWLAFHDDLADPNSADPIARESTRLTCAAVYKAQTSLDPQQMKAWIPNMNYGSHAFGIYRHVDGKDVHDFEGFLAARERILPWIQEYSPYAHVSADDPPIYLNYKAPPVLGQPDKETAHSASFGLKLQEKLQEVGVECELVYPGASNVRHPEAFQYVVEKLTTPSAPTRGPKTN